MAHQSFLMSKKPASICLVKRCESIFNWLMGLVRERPGAVI